MAQVSKLASDLAKFKKIRMEKEGVAPEKAQAVFEKELQMVAKANEVENQASDANVGYDLVPASVTMTDVIDVMINKNAMSSFLGGLTQGFHGNNLQKNVNVPIIGDIGFARGASEWTTGTNQTSQPTNTFATDTVSIPQKKLYYSVGISDYLDTFSVVDILPKLREMTAGSFTHTIADAVLNADSSTATTGNINSDDAAAATTFAATGGALDRRILFNDGLRLQPIAGTANVDKYDVGTLATDDFFTLMGLLRTDVLPTDAIMIMDKGTYYKAMALSDFKDMSINGRLSTVSTGAITNINGVDIFVTDLMRKTEADGKLSATGSNNTKGQIIVAKRNAIQRGFGRTLETNIEVNLEKGVLFEATAYFGFANINKLAGETSPSVVVGYNVSI
jgi:HK97 family phage major capsid protein